MAEIPVFNGGQVLQVGSSVPALSGATAGELMGDAVKEFGESGQRLFGTLLKKNRQDSDEMARLEAKQVATELKAKYALLEQRVAARGLVEGDKDGTLTAAKYREHAVNLKNETLAKYAGNKLMQLRIADNSDEELQSQFLQAFASATKNIELNKKTQEQEWLGSLIKEVEDRPENVGQIMARGELDIMQDASMPEAQKATAILARNTTLAQAVAQSYINKGNMATENPAQFFDRGLKMVDTLSPKIAPAELKKIQDDIVEKKNFRVRAVNDELDRQERVERRIKEDLKARMETDYVNRINERPFDEQHKQQVIADFMQNKLFHDDPDAIKRIQNLSTYTSGLADDRAEAQFYDLVAKGYNGNQMIKYVRGLYDTSALSEQKISAEQASKLMNAATHIKDSEQNFPQINTFRTSLVDYIKNMGKERYPNDKSMQTALSRASVNYLQMEMKLSGGGKPTPQQMVRAANMVIQEATNGAIVDDIPLYVNSVKDLSALRVPPKQRNNAERMDKATQEGAKNILKNINNMSDEQIKKQIEYNKSKQIRRKQLDSFDPSAAEKPAPAAGVPFKVFNK